MEAPGQKPVTLWNRNLIFAIFASLCIGATNQLLNPTMPVYLKEIGVDQQLAGIMTTAFALGCVIFRPFAGQLVDLVGRKKMLVTGALTCVLASVGYNFTDFFWALLALRVVHGCGMGLASTSIGTIVVDVIPRERMTEGIGYYGLAGAVSQTVGPYVGLMLQGYGGITAVFLGALVLSSGGLFFGSTIRYRELAREKKKFQLKIIEKTALYPASMMFITSMCQCTLSTFLALYGVSIGLSDLKSFFLITSIGIVCSRFFSGRLIRVVGESKVLVGACTISVTCFTIVAFARVEWLFYLAALIYGFGYGIIYPLANSMAMRNATPENRGAATATFLGSFDLGLLVGTFAWGFVYTNITFSGMYIVAAVMTLLVPLIYFKKFIVQYPEED